MADEKTVKFLADVAKETVLDEIPEKVRALDTKFHRCPACRKLFWRGTHVERSLKKLKKY